MRIRHRLSGSKIALASRCLYWARPDVPVDVDNDTPGRRIGSAFHELAEHHPDVDVGATAARWCLRPSEQEKVEELYAAWCEWWPTYIESSVVEREVPLAWDTATGKARRLPRHGHRDYSDCSWSEVPCTIDALIWGPTLEVLDLKTSYDIISAEEHAQLEACALAAANDCGVDEVKITIANVSPEGVHVNSATVGGFDFDAITGRLKRLVQDVPTAQPKPGGHCAEMWCPALGSCPATRVATDALARAVPDVGAIMSRLIASHDEAYRLRMAIKAAPAVLRQLDAMCTEWAEEHGGIRTPDGGVLKRVPVTKRTVDAGNRALRAKLGQMLGDDVKQAVKTRETISMGAVRRLVRAKAPRGQKERAEHEAMQELEATGGVRLAVYQKWSDEEEGEE